MALGLRFLWSALSGIAGYFFRLLPAHSAHLTNKQGIHDHPNLALLAIDSRDIVDKRVPPPFALVSTPLALSWNSLVVLGESGTTIPSNSHSHLSPSGFFQPSLTRTELVVDIRGRLVGKDPPILKPWIHCHRMLVKSGRRTTVGEGREDFG